MSPAPLPPHERPWRHPSELGAPDHEPTTTGGRLLIVSTATFGLLLVGLLALSMTPDRAASPDAVASTVTLPPVRVLATDDPPATAQSIVAPTTEAPSAPATSVAETSDVDIAPVVTPVRTLPSELLPLVTPIGDDGLAVTTRGAIGDVTSLRGRLPSGQIVEADVIADDGDDLVVLALSTAVRPTGLELSTAGPVRPTDTVVVLGDGDAEPMTVTVSELAALELVEGTPVTDADGNLIGICTMEPDPEDETISRTALMPVGTLPEVPPTTEVVPPTTEPSTTSTEPDTTAPESTEPPPTTATTVSEPETSTGG